MINNKDKEVCDDCKSERLEMDHYKDGTKCLDCGRFHLWRYIED